MENRLNPEMISLNKKLIVEQKKSNELSKTINELEQKLKNEIKINSELKGRIKDLEEKIKNYEKQIKSQLSNTNMNELINEIKELKEKIKRYPINLEKGEKLMIINFVSSDQKIQNCPILCKNTDYFNSLENQLYKKYEEYENNINYFTVAGRRILPNKTLKENQINDNDVVVLNIYQEFE